MSDRRVVVDASALLAWVLNERGADTIDKLLSHAVAPVSVMVEVLYRAAEKGHRLSGRDLYESLLEMGVGVEPVTDADIVRAAELITDSRRAGHEDSLSLGDGLCIAVAERLRLPLTGGDQYWGSVTMSVKFLPFRR